MTDQTNRPPFETFKGETIRLRQLVVAREHEIERLQSALDAIQTERERVHGVTWILIRDGMVLLERCPKKAAVLGVGEWFIPGGKVEGDETPEQTLQREISEEWPDVQLSGWSPLPIIEGSAIPPGPRGLFLMRPFVITASGYYPDRSADGVELRWTPVADALASPVPQVRMMIAAALSSGGAPLRDETPARETCPHCEGSVLAETGALTMEGYAIAVDCACGDGSLAGYASHLERQLAALRAVSPSDETPEAAGDTIILNWLLDSDVRRVKSFWLDGRWMYAAIDLRRNHQWPLCDSPRAAILAAILAVSLDPEDTKHAVG